MDKTIMLVGSFNIIDPIEKALHKAGYSVLPLCCPEMARRYCETRIDRVRLLVTELLYEDTQGMDLCLSVRRMDGNMPLLLLGSEGLWDVVVNAFVFNVDLLLAPSDEEILLKKVFSLVGDPDVS